MTRHLPYWARIYRLGSEHIFGVCVVTFDTWHLAILFDWVQVKVMPWVVVGAGGLGAGKTSGAGTRGVSLDVVIGGRTGHSDTNGGESSDNRSKIHADCGPAENPSL